MAAAHGQPACVRKYRRKLGNAAQAARSIGQYAAAVGAIELVCFYFSPRVSAKETPTYCYARLFSPPHLLTAGVSASRVPVQLRLTVQPED